jgi:hypothetical protein
MRILDYTIIQGLKIDPQDFTEYILENGPQKTLRILVDGIIINHSYSKQDASKLARTRVRQYGPYSLR